jgi:transportin-1
MDGENLQELLQTIKDYHSPNRIVQDRARRNVKHVVHSPLYAKQLLHVLCRLDEVDEDEREFAGDLLEKHIRKHYGEYGEELKGSLKKECLIAISNPSKTVRNSAGYVIAAVVHALQGNAKEWPELMPTLQASLDSPDVVVAEGAMNTLCSMCERNAQSLLEPLTPLLPKVTQCLQHPHLPLRAQAIGCVFHLALCLQCQFVLDAFDDIFKMVMESVNVEHYLIRKHISSFLVFTAATVPNNLEPLLPSVLQFMMDGLMGSDELVAMNAGEFLIHMVEENQVPMEKWLPHLQDLISVLLKGMVYEDKIVESLNGNKEYDSSLAESTDIEPMEEGDGEDEQEALKDKENFELRKCCSGILDATVLAVGDEILQFFVPQVKLMLSSDDWKTVEAAVFGLGTVAEGCPEVLGHFPQIVPTIISLLSHKKPLIRSISSWTLSRHVKWIAANHNDLLQSVIMDSMLKAVLDSHPHAQQAALTALAETTEAFPELLVPYVSYILETLALALHSCPKTNLLILCDAITSLLESVEVDYNDKKYIEVIMPPMMEKLTVLNEESIEYDGLLESFRVLAKELKSGFLPYCPVVIEKCATSISTLLQQNGDDKHSANLLVNCLDVISGMVQGVKGDLVPLLNRSDVIAHLIVCLKMNDDDVLQSGFALLGDLADFCYDVIRAQVNEFVILCEAEMRKLNDTPSLSNAVWSLGKIIEKMGMEAMPYAETWLQILFTILQPPEMPGTMVNAVYTISNLAVACPEVVAPHLPILGPLCFDGMLEADEEEMKETVVFGLFTMIAVNPVAIEKDTLLQLLLSIEEVSDRLKEATQLGVTNFCASRNVDSFASLLVDLPNERQEILKAKYAFLSH